MQNADIPTTFIIFGITGDLARRKLLPALLSLYSKGILPKKFSIVGFSRRHFSREEFRQFVRDGMNVKLGKFKEETVKHFLDHMTYEQGLFDDIESYKRLTEKLSIIDSGFKQCSNKLFHLSVSPSFYETILENLSSSGLTVPCGGDSGWTRVLIEKPFGNDIETAKTLDKRLGDLFNEEQIFRIDHYLAKETLQNILAFRFANSIFEPLWSHHHIDKVHIKLLEKIDLQGRGSFYDETGALRDVGQNHILQMLALIAMEEPRTFAPDDIRKERAKVFKNLEPITPKSIKTYAVRGQYEGYRDEQGIKPASQTETYFRLEAYINSSRWKDTPFFLESGKALNDNRSEIDIYFKTEPGPKNEDQAEGDMGRQNVLTFRIQPDEGIKLRFWVKTPGFGLNVEPKTLKFHYADFSNNGSGVLPDAYEKVIYDAILGDQTLFTSTEEIMHSWKYITPISLNFDQIPLVTYKKGAREV